MGDWYERDWIRRQNKAKQWLEVVTGQPIPADANLQDVLADGNLLWLAARKIKSLMKIEGTDEKNRRKSAYTRYDNVAEFIQVCKDVGVKDIDLCVASDVVERTGDLHMPVTCLRALSKKCRAKDLPIPDFDNVSGFGLTSTPDSTSKENDKFPGLVMPSPAPEAVVSRSASEHDLGAIRRLPIDDLFNSPGSQTPPAKVPEVETASSLTPDSSQKSPQAPTPGAPTTPESLPIPLQELGPATSGAPIVVTNGSSPLQPLPVEVPRPESQAASTEPPSQRRALSPPSLGTPLPIGSGNALGPASDQVVVKKVEGDGAHTSGKEEAPRTAADLAGNKGRDVGAEKVLAGDKGDISRPINKGDVYNSSSPATPAAPTPAAPRRRKPVDDLPGGSYIVTTNDRKRDRDAPTRGSTTKPQATLPDRRSGADVSPRVAPNASDKATGGDLLPRVVPHPSQQPAAENRLTEAKDRATTPVVQPVTREQSVVGTTSRATPAAAVSSITADKGGSSPPLRTAPSAPQSAAPAKVVVSTTPVSPGDKRPAPAKGPVTTGKSHSDDKKVGDAPRKTVVPSQPKPNGSQTLVPAKTSSAVANDKRSADVPAKATPPPSQPRPIEKRLGTAPTKEAATVAQPKASDTGKAQPKASDAGKEADTPTNQVSRKRFWIPVIAGAIALVGTYLAVRSRKPTAVVYEVKQGDTLYKISKRSGKSNWEELVRINPDINNPDLIYPSERLKLN